MSNTSNILILSRNNNNHKFLKINFKLKLFFLNILKFFNKLLKSSIFFLTTSIQKQIINKQKLPTIIQSRY